MARNIILLSDGTGASSISPQKSNVWRLFEALDLGPNAQGKYDQFAFYDDGVGTSGFKLLRILGGGFGWGLSRNVRELYRKLCREYEPGDRIYIFGFSRGAFTARLLAHFIIRCGILDRSKEAPGLPGVTMEAEKGLHRGVRQAYKSYRRGYWERASPFLRTVAKPLRFIRNLFPRFRVKTPDEFKIAYNVRPLTNAPTIEFIGVFDTVDALGLPVAELRTLVDRWIYPYKFPDQELSPEVGRARQALAVDDERQTFHPLLWDETGVAAQAPGRLKQVWFSGMHTNVGGGYPEDNLAYIPLHWMMKEVAASDPANGLVFGRRVKAELPLKASPLGKLYDSRRGAAMYYRYGPRDIDALCNQKRAKSLGRNKVHVPSPIMHHSVLDRIADLKVGYAPTALPPKFRVMLPDGTTTDPSASWIHGPPPYSESLTHRAKRQEMMARARGHIFWRRVIYVCLLFTTLAVVFMPYIWPPIPGLIPARSFSGALTTFVGAAMRYASGYLPGFASYWTDTWTQSAVPFLILAAVFLLLFGWRTWVVGNLARVAEAGWWHVKGFPAWTRSEIPPGVFERNANRFQQSAAGKGLGWLWLACIMPYGFAVICLIILVSALYRGLWHYPIVLDGVCNLPHATSIALDQQTFVNLEKQASTPLASGESKSVSFETSVPCVNTGVDIEAGRRYRVDVAAILGSSDADRTVWHGGANFRWNGHLEEGFLASLFCSGDPESPWMDHETPATPRGFVCFWSNLKWPFLVGIPSRRLLSLPWFALVGEIGIDSGDVFPVNLPTFEFIPKQSGTLYLYVNDSIRSPICPVWLCPIDKNDWHWDERYRNNRGAAIVKITKVRL